MTSPARVPLALLTLGIAAFLAACGPSREPAGAVEAASPGTPGHPVDVTTIAVEDRDVPMAVQATGAFVADEVSDVAPESAGIVASTPVNVGDRVAAGDVVARLSTADATLRLEQARAGLLQAEAMAAQARERYNLARATAARYEALVATGDVSRTLQEQAATEAATTRQGVATAEAAIADARSRVALAQKALDDTTIRAPFDGFITERPAAVGEHVSTSSTVATVMKLDPIRLRLQVPELEASRLRVGQAVRATVEALDNQQFEGRVTAINPALDPATRATIVEATIANPRGAIRSGMFATAQVDLGTTERGLFVPGEAVVDDPNTNSFRVFTVSDTTARLRIVQPAARSNGQVRILSGISAGDQVVVSGLEELFDGAAVRPVSR
ncbi:MAG: efflux RND transporter periplasmic adaptor subunit [Acidobacteria bacterium]|nr:efflux RND transporter periplasmic adaptor subunit [Acidobacteriota bacterium]